MTLWKPEQHDTQQIHPTAYLNPTIPITLGKNVRIGPFCILGYNNPKLPIIIEDDVMLDCRVTLFGGVTIGTGTKLWNSAYVRSNVFIGKKSSIGAYVNLDGDTTIGDFVSITSQCHLTRFSTIEDGVFIGPLFCSTNDKRMGYRRFDVIAKGVTIREGVRIGGGVLTLPEIIIGKNAFIAAGALLTKDVEENAIMMGVPARKVGEVPLEERV